MKRQIIHIDEEKCIGCGMCANACHEGAIDMVDGKAKLVREHFCDGFGDCLPACPAGAITFEEREAPAYDEAAVKASKNQTVASSLPETGKPADTNSEIETKKQTETKKLADQIKKLTQAAVSKPGPRVGGCPGSRFVDLSHREEPAAKPAQDPANVPSRPVSRLNQWPCQIKLLPTKAPFYDGAKLLIAADCTAYAYANMHEDFMKGRITLIGCPKLDAIDYSEKLTAIIRDNDIKSVLIVRMDVPCCGGLQRAAETALRNSGKFIPWQVVTIGRDGQILDR